MWSCSTYFWDWTTSGKSISKIVQPVLIFDTSAWYSADQSYHGTDISMIESSGTLTYLWLWLCLLLCLQALNPILIVILIPLSETVIYPLLEKCGLLKRWVSYFLLVGYLETLTLHPTKGFFLQKMKTFSLVCKITIVEFITCYHKTFL